MYSANLSLQEYQKAIEDADEKVSIATQVYDLVSLTCKWIKILEMISQGANFHVHKGIIIVQYIVVTV